jgi:hypothetical protein
MKLLNITYLTGWLFLISACSHPDRKPVDFKTIENVMNLQTQEWNKGNIDGFMQGYWRSDSLKFITRKGVKMGYDSVSMSYKKNYDTPEKMGHLIFTDLKFYELDQHGTLVHCTGKWVVNTKEEGEHSGIFSLLFKNFEGDWKIIVDHTW